MDQHIWLIRILEATKPFREVKYLASTYLQILIFQVDIFKELAANQYAHPHPGVPTDKSGWFHYTPINTIVAGRLGISGEKVMKLLNNGSLSCFLWVNLGRIERSCPGCTRKVWQLLSKICRFFYTIYLTSFVALYCYCQTLKQDLI